MKKSKKTVNPANYPVGPVAQLKPLCRKLAAEGSVLLENDGVLPFGKGQKVAVFGRTQETYIKSGTGSGGLVRVEEAPCIIESLRENGVFQIDEELVGVYREWIKENPFDNGHGWATEPWSQKEMPLDDDTVKAAAQRNDAAVIIIGRTAGEDRDNSDEFGSFRLSETETAMIKAVTTHFEKTVVILNVGNLIDLSFVDEFPISALMYVWQGGQEGANALADLLSGKISPCGKLPDTQALTIQDYPSCKNFGDQYECIYEEDIYVGYRYFETFLPDRVRYPFGYGITYTDFDVTYTAAEENGIVTIKATVKNIGNFTSRQTVQIYFGAPCGKLGTPAKQLIAYAKTNDLKPREAQTLCLSFDVTEMSSYDDSGITGYPHAYVLEAGDYILYCGTDVRSAEPILTYTVEKTRLITQLEQIMPPEKDFSRFTAVADESGARKLIHAPAPVRDFDLDNRIHARRPKELPYTANRGILLVDVAKARASMKDFISQMTDHDLANLVCGEGMNSPKVMVGTGGAFGGVTCTLSDFGIPVCCVTDGPSGIRIGADLKSTSLPNGYVFASAFDDELTEKIFRLESVELYNYDVDTLLGPGLNLHRHPLCGRNFEYFSEDPLLSGRMAAAQSRGLSASGCSATIKHFCCNNQEFGRYDQNVVVSERALREIYLKGFEIAVKQGGATAVMTSYNSVNGYWCASSYDLTTTVLRNEWGFNGIVMTDWWAKCNCKGEVGTRENLKALVRAHNDLYMVCDSAEEKPHNILEGLKEGYITRGDLQYCAENILRYIINSPTFEKFVLNGCKKPEWLIVDETKLKTVSAIADVVSGKNYTVDFEPDKQCVLIFEVSVPAGTLAQYPLSLSVDGELCVSLSVSNDSSRIVRSCEINAQNRQFVFEFSSAVKLTSFTVKQS